MNISKLLFVLFILSVGCFFLFIPNITFSSEIKVLFTGFEEFGGYNTNPSQELVRYINSSEFSDIEGVKIKAVTLPVVYEESWTILQGILEDYKPDFIIASGYAPESNEVCLELVAKNMDLGFEDNKGKSHYGPIIPTGKYKYFSTLPIKKIHESLLRKRIPSKISDSAGGYLCNNIFYRILHYSNNLPSVRAGFIHLPMWSTKSLWSLMQDIIVTTLKSSIKVGVFEYEPIHDNVSENINKISQLIKDTKGAGIKFYIFPEMSLSGLSHKSQRDLLDNNPLYNREEKVYRELKSLAKENGVYLALGMVENGNNRLYNSYYIFSPLGEIILKYRKNNLYGSDFNWASDGDSNYPILNMPFGKIGVLICHDVVYPKSFTFYKQAGVNFFIVGTNWIGDVPIHNYLKNEMYENATFFISDRKGEENDIVFKGNTSVFTQNNTYYPYKIKDKYRGIIYLFINY